MEDDITVQELKERLEKGEQIVVIDVRELYEYEEFHFADRNIPLATLPAEISELEELKGEEVVVHCRTGSRSEMAKYILKQAGFQKVRNLIGGLEAWQKEG